MYVLIIFRLITITETDELNADRVNLSLWNIKEKL